MNDEQKAVWDILESMGLSALERFVPVVNHLELSLLDYMTIRDLVELGECRGDEAIAIVLMVMLEGLQEGNLCLNIEKRPFLDRLPNGVRAVVSAAIDDFLAAFEQGKYNGLVTNNGRAYVPLVLDRPAGEILLYFQKYYAHEQRLKDRVESFLNETDSFPVSDDEIDAIVEEIYTDALAIRVGRGRTPIVKDPKQVEAIRLTLHSGFSIISGGPGTGKTSLMVNILRCFVRRGISVSRIVLGAPTGRAAQRMTEAIQNDILSIERPSEADASLLDLKGNTLHKILGYRSRTHDFDYRGTNPLSASVVIVDEVSMIDVVMMDAFLQAIDPTQTKLVLLGDKHQLPSVEAGAVFAEMIPDGTKAGGFENRFVNLRKVYRSGIGLLTLANHVNQGRRPSFVSADIASALSKGPDQWTFVQAAPFEKWQADLHLWARHRYLFPVFEGEESYGALITKAMQIEAGDLVSTDSGKSLLSRIFRFVERSRILSVLRKGLYGCNFINRTIADCLMPTLDPSTGKGSEVFSGALIIITRNDYSRELFNGDVGVVVKNPHQSFMAIFQRSGGYFGIPLNLLASWELAFGMTVHKSQGSEFDDVLLVLPDDENHRLLTREIVYTGITRAKKRVILYGSKTAFNNALQKKITRQSGLMWS